jgi:hypothetical protein
MNGYASAKYADSLAEFGKPRFLPHCGGWVLERPIASTTYNDAMGCYPLFACRDWSRLHKDLDELRNDLVSLAIVADPFGDYDPQYLRKCFPDLVNPFKQHLVIDLSRSPDSFVSPHHRRNARKALQSLHVDRVTDGESLTAQWTRLYDNLIARRGIRGLRAFSPASFKKQLAVPGIEVFRASFGAKTVGMTLWYVDRGVAYYHLGAYSDSGYELRASFALFWTVIEYFSSQHLQWINLGAGVGTAMKSDDGLNRFKRGWATGERSAYFCGSILNQQHYTEATKITKISNSNYFPAYRTGEFA